MHFVQSDTVGPQARPLECLDLDGLLLLPALATECGAGHGLAVCLPLGLLVTSDCEYDLLTVWSLPAPWGSGPGPGLTLARTLGGRWPPMAFHFVQGGRLAFTHAPPGASPGPLLLVTDQGNVNYYRWIFG